MLCPPSPHPLSTSSIPQGHAEPSPPSEMQSPHLVHLPSHALATYTPESLESSELLPALRAVPGAPGPSRPSPLLSGPTYQLNSTTYRQIPRPQTNSPISPISHCLWAMPSVALCLLPSKLCEHVEQHCCGTNEAPGLEICRGRNSPQDPANT